MHDCRVRDGHQGCLYVVDGASVDVEGCSLEGSETGPGLHVEGPGSAAILSACRISGNAGPGIQVLDQGLVSIQVGPWPLGIKVWQY